MSKAIVDEIMEGVNAKIDSKFDEMNNKSIGGSEIVRAIIDTPLAEIQDKDLRSKAYADAFVNEWQRTGRISEKAIDYFQSSVSESGGYLVPQDLLGRIIKRAGTISRMRQLATVEKTSRNSLEIVVEDSNDGFSASWSGEASAKGDTQSTGVTKITIDCFDIYAKPKATLRNLSDNAFDLEGYIVEKIGLAFGKATGNAYLYGNGTDKPNGLIPAIVGNSTALLTASKVTFGELNFLLYSIEQEYAEGSVWMMSRKTLGAINGIIGTDGHPIFRMPEIRQEGTKVDGYLLNMPVHLDDNMPDIATATVGEVVIVFGNIARAYTIVDHDGMYQERDSVTETGFVKFPTIMRTGGKPILPEAVKSLKQI